MDADAIAAAWDITKRLGTDPVRELLAVLELPDDQRCGKNAGATDRGAARDARRPGPDRFRRRRPNAGMTAALSGERLP
jgi:hypothetical protein